MRKVFLLMALCLVGALVFAPEAMAQSTSASSSASASASAAATGDLDCGQLSEAEEQAVFDADPTDPNGLDADDDGLPCEDDTTDDGSFTLPTEEPEETMMEETMMEETMVVEPTEMTQPTEGQYGGGGTATPTATVEPLPASGGASVLALGAGVLLVIGGLLARRIVR